MVVWDASNARENDGRCAMRDGRWAMREKMAQKKAAGVIMRLAENLCAQNRSRTCTSIRTLHPEYSASANSAIWAKKRTLAWLILLWNNRIVHHRSVLCREGGIRTLDRIAPITVFETAPFNRSGTSLCCVLVYAVCVLLRQQNGIVERIEFQIYSFLLLSPKKIFENFMGELCARILCESCFCDEPSLIFSSHAP
jgi:hypothetical protein